ncbi:MAG: ABC transporter ATP-binding protein [Saprospiraceae bacterium]|nr:ABC transporter ATP-binding protein [Saprospiraceae bacterium]
MSQIEHSMLSAAHLTKQYRSANGQSLTVLDNVSFELAEGDTFAVVGPSGSGKTTLLGLCAGLDRATSGSISLNNIQLDDLSEDERAEVRNRYVGFIFQNFQLIPTLTALENVMVPLELRRDPAAETTARQWLEKVGLADRLDHYPAQLSGGEQQRVCIARAFSNSPKILFADEPTGNLDADNAAGIVDLIFDLNRTVGTTLVLVTHDLELAKRTKRILKLKGGKIESVESNVNVRRV